MDKYTTGANAKEAKPLEEQEGRLLKVFLDDIYCAVNHKNLKFLIVSGPFVARVVIRTSTSRHRRSEARK